MPIKSNVILYESFAGAGMIDNPYGIFCEFAQTDEFRDWTHVWVLKDFEENKHAFLRWAAYPNIKYVLYGSDEYLKYISIAKVLINNCTFPSYWTKKDGQTYINTWHGFPLKKLFFDLPNNEIAMGNTLRNFLCTDCILCGSDHEEWVFNNSARLFGQKLLYPMKQMPREKVFSSKEETFRALAANGFNFNPDKKIAIYAPTWRGTLRSPTHPNIDEVTKVLTKAGYQVLVKPHHVNYEKKKEYVPSSFDMNVLLEICDLLITDYSSVQVDWMRTGKPIVYFAPDLADYEAKQGLYFDFPCAPATNLAMLESFVSNLDAYWMRVSKSVFEAEKRTHYLGQKGHTTLDLVKAISGRQSFASAYKKTRLLFYPGDLKPNGVTNSFFALLKSIDYTKYDVSVLLLKKETADYQQQLNRIPSSVRVFVRPGTYSQTLLEHCANDIILKKGIGTQPLFNKYLVAQPIYWREFKRCFGGFQFDYAINYTGYSPFYSFLLEEASGRHVMWMHNVMRKDQMRCIDGRYPLRGSLETVFSTYQFYDTFIHVSEQAMKENCADFPSIADSSFVVGNLVDHSFIMKHLTKGSLPRSFDSNRTNYVNVARLSPAKNQIALIRAFKHFYKVNPFVHLYIVGDGELRSEIEREIGDSTCITLVGYTANPYVLTYFCDYSILPSLYEGQGISILEARYLGTKTIVSNLGEIEGVCDGNQTVTIEGDDELSIYKALTASLDKVEADAPPLSTYLDYEAVQKLRFQEAIPLCES